MTQDTFTIADLCQRWHCARQTIMSAVREGRLKAFKVNKRVWRVAASEVDRFELEQPGMAQEAS